MPQKAGSAERNLRSTTDVSNSEGSLEQTRTPSRCPRVARQSCNGHKLLLTATGRSARRFSFDIRLVLVCRRLLPLQIFGCGCIRRRRRHIACRRAGIRCFG
jgi:hypothetical protein